METRTVKPILPATPARLRNGSWGARVQGAVKAGDLILVKTKAGKVWDAQVTKVIWAGEGVTLCATGPGSTPAHRAYGRGHGHACKTDGNCSSIGNGRSCGGYDCDGWR